MFGLFAAREGFNSTRLFILFYLRAGLLVVFVEVVRLQRLDEARQGRERAVGPRYDKKGDSPSRQTTPL